LETIEEKDRLNLLLKPDICGLLSNAASYCRDNGILQVERMCNSTEISGPRFGVLVSICARQQLFGRINNVQINIDVFADRKQLFGEWFVDLLKEDNQEDKRVLEIPLFVISKDKFRKNMEGLGPDSKVLVF